MFFFCHLAQFSADTLFSVSCPSIPDQLALSQSSINNDVLITFSSVFATDDDDGHKYSARESSKNKSHIPNRPAHARSHRIEHFDNDCAEPAVRLRTTAGRSRSNVIRINAKRSGSVITSTDLPSTSCRSVCLVRPSDLPLKFNTEQMQSSSSSSSSPTHQRPRSSPGNLAALRSDSLIHSSSSVQPDANNNDHKQTQLPPTNGNQKSVSTTDVTSPTSINTTIPSSVGTKATTAVSPAAAACQCGARCSHVKILVNDITPSSSQELLLQKTAERGWPLRHGSSLSRSSHHLPTTVPEGSSIGVTPLRRASDCGSYLHRNRRKCWSYSSLTTQR